MPTEEDPNSEEQSVDEEPRRCPYCGKEAPVVWVHGHGQCANCGVNIKECCQGEQEQE